MKHLPTIDVEATPAQWPYASGEMAERIRVFDWSSTPLGPIESWPPGLRAAVEMMLGCAFPSTLQWGPDLLLFYNDAYVSLIESRHPVALGRPILETFPDIAAAYRPFVERVRRGERLVLTEQLFRYARRDHPEDRWFDLSYSPVYDADGSVSGIHAVGLDTTERRRAELARASADLRVRRMMETEGVGIIIFDSASGTVVDANEVFLGMVGYTRDDVESRIMTWRRLTPPEWIAASEEQMRKFHETGRVGPYEKEYFRQDGSRRWMLFAGRDLGDGTICEYAIDISDRKRAEQALLQSEKLAAVGRLAASIAHEINNPLESVTNLLYLARTSDSLERVADYLKSADHELRRVSTIANQTLRFHKQAASPQPALTEELVETVLSIYEGRLRNSNIKVHTRYRAQEPVMCFGGDIRQVLNNLVGNAIEAMSRRGGVLSVRSHAARDWKTGRPGIAITIADSGAGIPKDNLKRIFEPFFTTKGIGGTGLGLWICQEVATRHQGVLRVRSSDASDRSGTVFRFFLPFSMSKVASASLVPVPLEAEVQVR
jgi:PAS domain S-box-containing protein